MDSVVGQQQGLEQNRAASAQLPHEKGEHFSLLAQEGEARAATLTTSHGVIETPVFMAVGTRSRLSWRSGMRTPTRGPAIEPGDTVDGRPDFCGGQWETLFGLLHHLFETGVPIRVSDDVIALHSNSVIAFENDGVLLVLTVLIFRVGGLRQVFEG